MKPALALPAAATAALTLFGTLTGQTLAQELPTGIQTIGEATVDVENDLAVFLVTLAGKGNTPQEARNQLAPQSQTLKDTLKTAEGIRETATAGLSSEPIYQHLPNRPPMIIGYKTKMTTVVKCASETAGDLATTLLGLNPESVDGPNFSISDETRKKYEIALLKEAALNAEEKARAISETLGRVLGDPVFVDTQALWGQNGPVRPMMAYGAMDSMAGQAPESLPTEAGKNTLKTNITVRFETEPKCPWKSNPETGSSMETGRGTLEPTETHYPPEYRKPGK